MTSEPKNEVLVFPSSQSAFIFYVARCGGHHLDRNQKGFNLTWYLCNFRRFGGEYLGNYLHCGGVSMPP